MDSVTRSAGEEGLQKCKPREELEDLQKPSE